MKKVKCTYNPRFSMTQGQNQLNWCKQLMFCQNGSASKSLKGR